jgi:hypothetical protein
MDLIWQQPARGAVLEVVSKRRLLRLLHWCLVASPCGEELCCTLRAISRCLTH